MHCPRCHVKMRQTSRSHHKRRKWTCPRCGRARMQDPGLKPRDRRSEKPRAPGD